MRNWRLDEDEEEGEPKPDMPMTAGPVQNALFKSRTVLIFGPINMRLQNGLPPSCWPWPMTTQKSQSG